MTDQTNAVKAAEQPLPSYGKLPFDQLGRDVTEATMGVRQPFDFGPNYPGHAMCLINFNSLARIVDKYRLPEASAPVAGETQPVCWIERAQLESVRDEGNDAWVYWRETGHAAEPDEVPLYATPQASEAVRNQALEEAAAIAENSYADAHIRIRALKTQVDKDGGGANDKAPSKSPPQNRTEALHG